jgi:hypothetical protein
MGGAFDQDVMGALYCCTSLPAARIGFNVDDVEEGIYVSVARSEAMKAG